MQGELDEENHEYVCEGQLRGFPLQIERLLDHDALAQLLAEAFSPVICALKHAKCFNKRLILGRSG